MKRDKSIDQLQTSDQKAAKLDRCSEHIEPEKPDL